MPSNRSITPPSTTDCRNMAYGAINTVGPSNIRRLIAQQFFPTVEL
jgi:hypothetical protein